MAGMVAPRRTRKGERVLVQGWVMSRKANNSTFGSGGCCEGQEGGLKKPTEPGEDGSFPPFLCYASVPNLARISPAGSAIFTGHTQPLLPLREVPKEPAASWDLLPSPAQSLPGCCPPPTPPLPPGLILSGSLRTELGPAFCKCEPKSSGVTLLQGGFCRVMPPPPPRFSGHLLPSISLCLTTKVGGLNPADANLGGGQI